jgi:branched-chain amino acid transport system permease protein
VFARLVAACGGELSAVSASDAISGLPDWLSGPLSEPLFVLGVLFVVLVLYAPGGLASIASTLKRSPRVT